MANWQRKDNVLFASGSRISVTGITVEQSLKALTIPANTIEVGDILEVSFLIKVTDNANAKRSRIMLGGSYINDYNMANNGEHRKDIHIVFPTTSSVRLFNKGAATDGGQGAVLTADETAGIDITADMTLDFRAALTVATDEYNLDYYLVRLIKAR